MCIDLSNDQLLNSGALTPLQALLYRENLCGCKSSARSQQKQNFERFDVAFLKMVPLQDLPYGREQQ